MSDRELRDVLERTQHQNEALRATVRALKDELTSVQQQLTEARAEQERLARLLAQGVLNAHRQTSAFSVDQVAALVEFLKKSR